MSDTSNEIEEMQNAFFRSKTQSQKLEMCIQMMEDGRKLVESTVRNAHPEFSEGEIKAEIFKRFYSSEYPPDELQAILNWFKSPNPA